MVCNGAAKYHICYFLPPFSGVEWCFIRGIDASKSSTLPTKAGFWCEKNVKTNTARWWNDWRAFYQWQHGFFNYIEPQISIAATCKLSETLHVWILRQLNEYSVSNAKPIQPASGREAYKEEKLTRKLI